MYYVPGMTFEECQALPFLFHKILSSVENRLMYGSCEKEKCDCFC